MVHSLLARSNPSIAAKYNLNAVQADFNKFKHHLLTNFVHATCLKVKF